MHLLLILGIVLSLAASSIAGPSTNSAPSKSASTTNTVSKSKKPPLKIGKITFEGGDGSSIENAVIIKGAKNSSEGVAAESKWVNKVHPGWKKGNQALLSEGDRSYDKIDYVTPSGEAKEIYFDITDFFGKM